VCLAGVFFGSSVVADSKSPEVIKDKDLPKRGVLASTYAGGQGINDLEEPFGGDDPSGKSVAPITGSVSRASVDSWVIKVFNNSESDTYSVDVEVAQRDGRDVVCKRDFFTYKLEPKKSNGQPVSAGVGSETAQLTLVKYKNLTAGKGKGKK
jgi:hypothetical protein